MNKIESVEKFIELRALGYTFDEIVIELKVSKPTLIKWGKEYETHIKLTERKLAEKLSEIIAQRNSFFLMPYSDMLFSNRRIRLSMKIRTTGYTKESQKNYMLCLRMK
jgi:hypothetical protein